MNSAAVGDPPSHRSRTLSVVVPALNEARNIVLTVDELIPIARSKLEAFELILVNDGSEDGTGEAMEKLAGMYEEVRVLHHAQRTGVGASYKEGVLCACMDYVTLIPGDHEVDPATWPEFLDAVGRADLVVGYRVNQSDARPRYRVALSRLYTRIMAALFGVRLRDFHSLVIYPTELAKRSGFRFTGYTYQLEMLVKLFREHLTFVQVPVVLLPIEMRSSRSLSFSTLRDVVRTTFRLFIGR